METRGLTQKELAQRLGMCLSYARGLAKDEAGLRQRGYVGRGEGNKRRYYTLEGGAEVVDVSAEYAKEKLAKIKADKNLVLQKTDKIRRENIERAAGVFRDSFEEGFRGYPERLNELDIDNKNILIEDWAESWRKTREIMNRKLQALAL